MTDGKNILLGIVAIILGLIVLAFPLLGVFTASAIAGIGIMALGIWLFIQSFETWKNSKAGSIALLILGIIALMIGLALFGHIMIFSFLASFWFYFAGFFLLITGFFSLFAGKDTTEKGVGIFGIVLGILYIILGTYAWNPLYLGFLIGIYFIFSGIMQFFAD
ncbi:DUF308 domain-containing protein [Methanobacterium alcaliphilum]|uniref:DUF308 domain-containing protein n=1 Tax=Methanobacterium alcaliphilum TaxID=392018 RepID=UPI00200A3E2B|nr:DUF308 domain-containing protein [Methanobacterium alcaliphilum]MCK9151917.1 DUF308 domain-containing protein [Methanobacterium alcaliphilum]